MFCNASIPCGVDFGFVMQWNELPGGKNHGEDELHGPRDLRGEGGKH
jgi:hypothetical protein